MTKQIVIKEDVIVETLADRLAVAWGRYHEVFCTVPHGTKTQMAVLLILAGGAETIRACTALSKRRRKHER